MTSLDKIVKTYDVRGLVDTELTQDIAEALGFGFAEQLDSEQLDVSPLKFVIGYDMRESSLALAAAFTLGARLAGAQALDIGLCSTDMTYYASGALNLPAVMFTASHNPASYNGIKFSRAGARGISLDTGLGAIRDRAKKFLQLGKLEPLGPPPIAVDITGDYVSKLRSMVSLGERRLKVVVDAANGMAGMTVPLVLGDGVEDSLNLEIIELYFDLDGSFPNHEANPLDEKNLADLKLRVLAENADLGLAFDGDADRCFVVDERGESVSPSAICAIVAKRELTRAQSFGAAPSVIHNLLTSRFVPETISRHGGRPVETRVGHSLIKDQMAATGAVFGGEHSAHYYFRDFWGADNGMLAAMHVLAELGSGSAKMSELSIANNPYFQSGEINLTVSDPAQAKARVRAHFDLAQASYLDGLTLAHEGAGGWWWLNLRSSNTEPLLRLNVESNSQETMHEIRDIALALIE